MGDLSTVGHGVPGVFQREPVARLDPLVVGGIGELQWQDAEVDQVLPVDTGVGLGDDQSQTEVAGDDRGMLAGGALAVVGAADDRVLAGLTRPLRVIRVDVGEREFGKLGDVFAGLGIAEPKPVAGRAKCAAISFCATLNVTRLASPAAMSQLPSIRPYPTSARHTGADPPPRSPTAVLGETQLGSVLGVDPPAVWRGDSWPQP